MAKTAATLLAWQDEEIYDLATDYFNGLIKAIHLARSSIIVEFYIFENDLLGKKVISALLTAAKRGVHIQVLIDGIGSFEHGESIASQLEREGIEIKIYHPLPWQIKQYRHSLSKGNLLQKLIRFIRLINRRDHRKLCIIDNEELWTGSFNISQKHMTRQQGGENWRDYGARVKGKGVKLVKENFDALWYQRKPHALQGLFLYYWQNISTTTRKRKNKLLVEKITHAAQRVWITSAYFAPSSAVIRALKAAAKKQIDVKILVPRRSDIPFFPKLTSTYYSDLLRDNIEIYEYLPGILHAKALIIDQLYLLGSTNFNHRSFLHDLELDIVLMNPDAQASLERFFLNDINQSEKIDQTQRKQAPIATLSGWLSRLLRYWM